MPIPDLAIVCHAKAIVPVEYSTFVRYGGKGNLVPPPADETLPNRQPHLNNDRALKARQSIAGCEAERSCLHVQGTSRPCRRNLPSG